MSDINANIGINFDSAQALAELKNLQRQLSQFYTSITKGSESAAIAQRNLQTNFLNSINASGNFVAQMGVIKTSTESFTHALETNKLSMREYFRYAGASTKTFGQLFTNEFNTISKVAEERVKRLQTQYIKMGRDTTGAMRAMSIMPASLDMKNLSTQTQIAAQKQALFNQLLKQGSTQLLNFGKNTQWAGRQLMVGFTVPLGIFASQATRAFADIEAAAIKFKKVYGDLATSPQQTQAMLDQIREVANAFTQYGVAVKDTIGLASDAAAAGYENADLIAQTTSATKLSVLGQIDNQQALKTTIALQSAFNISAKELTSTIDFLNATENQTVLSLDDVTTAIPLVSPVIKQLGGSVKDLTFFLTAMKEGGVSAAQGANALKSGLASLINPTAKAQEMLKGVGIDIMGIVEKDKGNLTKTVVDFANALNTLDPLSRARAIETMFGKFQFARISTLFQNITKDGSQASRVLDLMGMSATDLASISSKELGTTAASALTKFRASIEKLRASLAPVGELFMKIFTPIIESIGKLLDKFNNLSDGMKKTIAIIVGVIGGLGPIVLMTFGLLANAFANSIKLFATLRMGYLKLTGQSKDLGEQTQYLTTEQIDAAAAAHSLDQSHAKLNQTFTVQKQILDELRAAYLKATAAAETFKITNPGMMLPPGRRMATGGIISGPGTGTSDSIPAMLSNGEAVIPAKNVKKYPGMVAGLVAGNIPGFATGVFNIGGQEFSLNVHGQTNINALQALIDRVVSQIGKIDGLEEILVETLSRVSTQTGTTLDKFVAQLQHSARNLQGISLGEQIIGRQTYSAPKSLGTVKKQIEAERGSVGLEEYQRAKTIAEQHLRSFMQDQGALEKDIAQVITIMNSVNNQAANLTAEQKQYVESFGLSSAKVSQLLQVDRAHIVEFLNEEKKYVEAWHSNVWVAQPHLENEMSNTLKKSVPAREAYLKSLEQENISAQEKAQLIEKINNNAALTDRELDIQASVLRRILEDINVMSTLTANFGPSARALISAQELRSTMPAPSAGVGTRDVTGAVSQVGKVKRAINLGTETFQPMADGERTLSGWFEGAERVAETKSPSRRAYRLGKNIIQGLVNALRGGAPEVEAAAQQVADEAIQQPRTRKTLNTRGASSPGGTVGPGGVIIPVTATDPLKDLKDEAKKSKMSLSQMNNALMAGTFALTSIAGAGTMAGGAIGTLSGQIMKYSGLLFGLMNVTQLLTQMQFAELAAKRIGLAKSAVANVVAEGAGSVAGRAGMLGSLARVGVFAKSLLGLTNPIGLTITALTAGIAIYKLVHAAQERTKQSIEGLGKAANISSGQISKLGSAFGVNPFKGSLETYKPTVVATTQQRTLITQAREALSGDKSYQQDVAALQKASLAEAKSMLQSRAMKLLGAGFAKDQVQAIIDAMEEDAGRTKLQFKVDSIDVTTKEGKEGLQKTAQKLIDDYKDAFQKGYKKTSKGYLDASGNVVNVISEQMSKDLKTKLSTASQEYAAFFTGLSNQFQQGQISAKDLSDSFDSLTGSISGLTSEQAAKLIPAILGSINDKLPASVQGLNSLSDQFKVLKAAMVGLDPDQILKLANALKVLQNPSNYSASEIQAASDALTKISAEIDKKVAAQEKTNTDGKKTIDDSAGTKTDPYAFLQGAAQSLKNFRNIAFDAEKPINSIMRILSGKKNLGAFDGLAQKLAAVKSTALKGISTGKGMSEGFMDALLGLDQASFKRLEDKLYKINKKTGEITLTAKGRAANKLFDMAALGESLGAMQKATRQTNNQVKSYDMLRKSGLDSATAMKIAGDAALASAIAGGRISLASKEWKEYKKAIDAATEANKKFAVTNLIDQLNHELELQQKKKEAIEKLTAAGISLARAEEITADEANAYAIANEKIDSANWPILLDLIKKTGKGIEGAENALDAFTSKLNKETKFKTELGAIIPKLKEMGMATEDIDKALNDPEFGQALIDAMKDGEAGAIRLKKYIDEATKSRTVDIYFNLVKDPKQAVNQEIDTLISEIDSKIASIDSKIQLIRDKYRDRIAQAQKDVDAAQAAIDAINKRYDALISNIESQIAAKQEYIAKMFDAPIAALQDRISVLQKQMEDLIDKPISILNEKIAVLQRQIEMTIDRPIAALNEKIAQLQHEIDIQYTRPLQALSDESEILSNNLTILGKQEEAINEKYDKQISALEQVNKLNEQISNQKKSQLTIADALSKGDIAAAAKAIEEFRAQQASAQAQTVTDAMNAARKAELEGLTINGMTKAQIEQRQYEIQQQSFKLQQQQKIVEKQIRDYQDQIYQLELQRKPLQEQILQYQDQIYQIELGRKAIQDQIKAIEDQIAELEKQKKVVLDEIQGLEDQIKELKKKQNEELVKANENLDTAKEKLTSLTDEMNTQIDALEEQKNKWTDLKDKVIDAKNSLNEWSGSLNDANNALSDIVNKIASIPALAEAAAAALAAMAAAADAAAMLAESEAALKSVANAGAEQVVVPNVYTDAQMQDIIRRYTSGQYITPEEAAAIGAPTILRSQGGIVPEYLDDGGVAGIFKKRGTDTVPAMLTPGEYVINRASTKKFKPLLDKINKNDFETGREFGRAHNTKGKHLGWDKEKEKEGGKPETGGPLPPVEGIQDRTGSTRGGEARSYDPGYRGGQEAPSFANNGISDGMSSGAGGTGAGGTGAGGTGTGGDGTGATGGSGTGLSTAELNQQLSIEKQILEIEKQLLEVEKQRRIVVQAIAAIQQQITTLVTVQQQALERMNVIYTNLPELLKKIIEQLKIQKQYAIDLLDLLTKQYQIFDLMLQTAKKQNIENKIHKEYLIYFLDKNLGYPRLWFWIDQIWQKLKDGVNVELEKTDKWLKEIIKKNEQWYKDIEEKLVPAIDKANQALERVLGTMTNIAAQAKAALDSILALNTTVTTVHIIQEICIPCDSGGGGGVATGGLVAASKGGIIPKYFADGGLNDDSVTFRTIGTDTVPAMLTPGEYVINAQSTERFKPLLDSINAGQGPILNNVLEMSKSARFVAQSSGIKNSSMSRSKARALSAPSYGKPSSNARRLTAPTYSKTNLPQQAGIGLQTAVSKSPTNISDNSAVYNYSVNVNVTGEQASNPNDIATAVIQRIRQIEGQQIRRQVVK